MKEPTEKQVKELLRWCGLEVHEGIWTEDHYEPDGQWYDASGGLYTGEFQDGIPVLDLNNLFKYAVPKLGKVKLQFNEALSGDVFWNTEVKYYGQIGKVTNEDPALALFWAIHKVIK